MRFCNRRFCSLCRRQRLQPDAAGRLCLIIDQILNNPLKRHTDEVHSHKESRPLMKATTRKTTDATLSVIIVSDYAAGGAKAWNDLRKAVQAWVGQDYGCPVEFVLAESSRH